MHAESADSPPIKTHQPPLLLRELPKKLDCKGYF
jgi:hypothetical protein